MSADTLIITKDFLEHFFRERIKSFTVEPGTNPGDNYLSTIYSVRVILIDNDNTSEKNIIVKCYPENLAKREFLDSSGLFYTEYMIYVQFIPALNELAAEADTVKNMKQGVGINVAKFYGGNIVGICDPAIQREPWSSENFIILEDLRPKGYRMLDRRKGLDLHHCLLCINQLAKLHALSWVHKKRNKLDFLVTKYPYLEDGLYRIENEAGWRPVVEGFNRDALEVIQEEFGENSDIFVRLKSLFSRDVLAITRMFLSGTGVDEVEAENLLRIKPQEDISEPNEPYLVGVHGDAWTCNFLFKEPSEVVLVDHQAFREACLTTDLAYLIYSSMSAVQRKQSTSLLLQAYYDKFVEICTLLKEKPPLGFTYKNFLRKWHRARIFAVLMSAQFITFTKKPTTTTEATGKPQVDKIEMKVSNEDSIKDAYASATREAKHNTEWRKEIIDTMLHEYEAAVL